MEALQFCYWLQGYMEICDPDTIHIDEVKIIKDHLQLVFNKVTPSRDSKTKDKLCGSTFAPSDLNNLPYCSQYTWGNGNSCFGFEQIQDSGNLWKLVNHIPVASC